MCLVLAVTVLSIILVQSVFYAIQSSILTVVAVSDDAEEYNDER